MASYPKIVHTEEGMRDGLQIESADIPVAAKIRLLNALSKTGLKEINVGSFVSPKYTPQMACVEELITGFTPEPGVRYTYTALNDKGVERAKAYTPPLTPRISTPVYRPPTPSGNAHALFEPNAGSAFFEPRNLGSAGSPRFVANRVRLPLRQHRFF